MARVSAQEWADGWLKGIQDNMGKARRGIERTKKNPMQRAVAQIPKMRTNFNRAIDDGTVQRGFERVTFEEWRSKTLVKGLPRMEQGAQAAKNDVMRAASALIPHIDAGLAVLEGMPSTTSSEMDARMLYWKHHMEEAKGL